MSVMCLATALAASGKLSGKGREDDGEKRVRSFYHGFSCGKAFKIYILRLVRMHADICWLDVPFLLSFYFGDYCVARTCSTLPTPPPPSSSPLARASNRNDIENVEVIGSVNEIREIILRLLTHLIPFQGFY